MADGRGDLARWKGDDGEQLAAEVLFRLARGDSLAELGLPDHDGRIDLRGIRAPAPKRLRRVEQFGRFFEELGGLVQFKGTTLESVDMSEGLLESFRFFGARVVDCRFERAKCRDWRLWETDVIDTSFAGANLRGSMLGAWTDENRRGNVYRNVDFTRADLRDSGPREARFEDCDLSHARLDWLEFDGELVRCRFAGELVETIFYRDSTDGHSRPNPMEDVDFCDAELRWVEFRGLDLDRVKLPTGPDDLIVNNYRCVLERALEEFERGEHDEVRGFRTLLAHRLQWAGKKQAVGVVNRKDLVESEGEQGAEHIVEMLQRLETDCAGRRTKTRLLRALGR